MKILRYGVAVTLIVCGLSSVDVPARSIAANISGTWDVAIHSTEGDLPFTFVLKQDGEKVSGTYHGPFGPAEVTGAVESDEVALSVTVTNDLGGFTSRFSGKVTSATKMSGTVTGTTSDGKPVPWSANRKQ